MWQYWIRSETVYAFYLYETLKHQWKILEIVQTEDTVVTELAWVLQNTDSETLY